MSEVKTQPESPQHEGIDPLAQGETLHQRVGDTPSAQAPKKTRKSGKKDTAEDTNEVPSENPKAGEDDGLGLDDEPTAPNAPTGDASESKN